MHSIIRDLVSNRITSVEDGGFSGLINLTWLYVIAFVIVTHGLDPCALFRDLAHNIISSIAPGAFTGLGKLDTLYDRDA